MEDNQDNQDNLDNPDNPDNPDNLLILTIVIQMHGKVINFDLNTKQTDIFNNVRLLCKAGDFVDYNSTPINEIFLVSRLQDYFTHDLDISTYDILKKTKSGVLVDNITYDKSLSITIGEPTFWDSINPLTGIQGIYLLSIHSGKKLIYPDKNKDKKVLNLIKPVDLNILARKFNTIVPNIQDLSTIIPSQKIYIEEENNVKSDDRLSEEEKEEMIEKIRRQFYTNLYNWQLTLSGEKIVSIKLSTLVELIKTIVGKHCFINLLDYSCNSPTIYIPKEQRTLKQYALKTNDIEIGLKTTSLGGRKKKFKRKRKQTNKHKKRNKNRNKTRSKMK